MIIQYLTLKPKLSEGTNSNLTTSGILQVKSRNEEFFRSNLNVMFEYFNMTERSICSNISSPNTDESLYNRKYFLVFNCNKTTFSMFQEIRTRHLPNILLEYVNIC